MTVVGQLIYARWREANASFVWLDFGWYSNDHVASTPWLIYANVP
jgi:hypothetical protein